MKTALALLAVLAFCGVFVGFASAANTLHADYLASSAEEAVRIAKASLGGFSTAVSDFGTLNSQSPQGVSIRSTAGGFDIDSASTDLVGEIVGISSSGEFQVRGTNIEIESQTTTLSGASKVSFTPTGALALNVDQEIKIQTSGDQTITGNTNVGINSGEGAVIVKNNRMLSSKSHTLQVEGENGLFVVANSFVLDAFDTLDSDADSVKATSGANLLLQANFNDVQFNANDQLLVDSQFLNATASSGIAIQAAQGEVFINADNTIKAQADTFQVTAEKQVLVSSQGRLGITSFNQVSLSGTEGLYFGVTGSSFNINSTKLSFIAGNSFNVELKSDLLISSKDKNVAVSSTEDAVVTGESVVFQATQSALQVLATSDIVVDATNNPQSSILIGTDGTTKSTATVEFLANTRDASFSANTATVSATATSDIKATTALTVSANNDITDQVKITGSTTADFGGTTLKVTGGAMRYEGGAQITASAPATTFSTKATGASLPTIRFSSAGTTEFPATTSFALKAGEFLFTGPYQSTSTAITTMNAGNDFVGLVGTAATIIGTNRVAYTASSGALTFGGFAGTTLTGTGAFTLTDSAVTRLTSEGPWKVTTTSTLTSTSNSLHWNSTTSAKFTAQTNLEIGSASANQYFNGFSSVLAAQQVGISSKTISWTSPTGKNQDFVSAGSLSLTSAQFLRVGAPDVRVTAGTTLALQATTGKITFTSSTSNSINIEAAATFTTASKSVSLSSGGRSSLDVAGTLAISSSAAAVSLSSQSLAYLHSSTAAVSLQYATNFAASSERLAELVAKTDLTIKSVTAFVNYASRFTNVYGGNLKFNQLSATEPIEVKSKVAVDLNAAGTALFESTQAGLSVTASKDLSFTSTAGSLSVVAATTATYNAVDILLSGTQSVLTQATTEIKAQATKQAAYTGGSVSFTGNGVTLTTGTLSVLTAENLPLSINSVAGTLALTGQRLAFTSNNDVRTTVSAPVSYTTTTGAINIKSSGDDAAIVLQSGGDSTYTAQKIISLTVADRSFGARDVTLTSGTDTIQQLTGAAGAAAQPTAFAITSNGATFDNLLGYQVGILLRSNTGAAVSLASGAAIDVRAALGATFDVKSGPLTIDAGTTVSWLANGDDMAIEAHGALKVNNAAAANTNTKIVSTGTNAPLVVEATGTLGLSGASVQFQSLSTARGIEVLADDGHISISSATTLTNTAGGSISIEAGDAASFASAGATTIKSTGSNVQFESQNGYTLANTQKVGTDGVTVTAGVLSVSSSLDNDVLLRVKGAADWKSTSAAATVVQSGATWSFNSGAGGTSVTSNTGVVSVGSAGSASFSATGAGGVVVKSIKEQFWTGRDEIVFDTATLAQIGTNAARAVIHITAGGEAHSTGVEIETDGAASFTSAASVDLSAADRYVHTNQANGITAVAQGGFSLTSFGTPGADSDVVIAAGKQVTLSSADTAAFGPSGAISIESNGAGGVSFTANTNVLLQTSRNAQVYAQQYTNVLGDSWLLQAAQVKMTSDDRQTYNAGAISILSSSTSVFEANDGISMRLNAPNAGTTDIVFQTLQRDSGITFNARHPSSRLTFTSTAAAAQLTSTGADINVLGNGGVQVAASTWNSQAAEDFIFETSGATSIVAQTSITVTSNKPLPGSDVLVSSASAVRTTSRAATTWSAGINALTGITQGTNKISISADENVIFRNSLQSGGSIVIGDAVKNTQLHIETGRNSVVRSGVNWDITSLGQLQFSTDGLPTEDGFGSRWSVTGPLAQLSIASTTNDVTFEGVAGVQVDAGFVSLLSGARTTILAQGPSGIAIETTEPGTNILFTTTTGASHTLLANNGSISLSSTGADPQTGWILSTGPNTKFESFNGNVAIDSRLSSIYLTNKDFAVSALSGPVRFQSTGASRATGPGVGITFAATTTFSATSIGDINVRGASTNIGAVQDKFGTLTVTAGAEIVVTGSGDNARGNAIELISEDSTAPLAFNCGSQFIIESGGNAQLVGDRGVGILANDQVSITSFTNVTFVSNAQTNRQRLAADPYIAGIVVNTAGAGANGESIQVYSGSDTLVEAARNIVARARSSLVFESGGEVLFSAGGPIRMTASGPASFTTVADTLISSSRTISLAGGSLVGKATKASLFANGQPQQPGSGDLRITATGSSNKSIDLNATNNIFLGTGESVVIAPGSRLVIPTAPGITCTTTNNRALFYNTAINSLCFCAGGVQVCKPLV